MNYAIKNTMLSPIEFPSFLPYFLTTAMEKELKQTEMYKRGKITMKLSFLLIHEDEKLSYHFYSFNFLSCLSNYSFI